MATYSNGNVPYSVVSVVLAGGTDENGPWEFRCTPAFAARWAFAKRYAETRFGRTIYIRTGWNIYRPLFSQVTARRNACAAGNCSGAAVVGSSSHGGNWNGRDCLAVDVDPNGLTWDQVDEAMAAAGFAIQQITEAMSGISGGERWHYIDFNAFGPVPAGMDATAFTQDSDPQSQEEDDMALTIYRRGASIRVVGDGRDFRIGGELTLVTGVDGQEMLDTLIKGGARVIELDNRQWDVLNVTLNATAPNQAPRFDEAFTAKLVDVLVAKLPASGGAVDGSVVRAAVDAAIAANVASIASASADEEDRRDRERLGL